MNSPQRTSELIQRYLDGRLTATELAEFEQILSSDSLAAAAFVEAARLDASLSTILGQRQATADLVARLTAMEPSTAEDSARKGAIEPARPRHRRLAWSVATVAAAVVVAVASFAWQHYRVGVSEVAANAPSQVLTGEVLVDGDPAATVRPGSAISVPAGGAAVLRLSDGSQAEFDPDTSAVLHGDAAGPRQLVELVRGGGTFRVAKTPGEFQVATPVGRVTALGTEFSVKLTPSKVGDPAVRFASMTLAVAVLAGAVQVESSGETSVLQAGMSRVFGGELLAANRKTPSPAPSGKTASRQPLSPAAGENLLRNGSFEGGLLYWHNIEPDKHKLVRGDAAVGDYALRIEKSYVMSAPFVARRGEAATVSFFIKGDRPGTAVVGMPPSAREVGQKAKRLWCREGGQSVKVTTAWQRVSLTWKADVPEDGFWPNPHYLVQIGDSDVPIEIDGVTVTLGMKEAKKYVPRRPVEVLAECPDLPGFEGAKANLFTRGASPQVTAHVSNPGDHARDVTVRWQLFDYEGERAVSEPIEKKIHLDSGKTLAELVPMKLSTTGMVVARVSVWEKDQELDRSELPLTSLPYPKSATKPDWRERFGSSFAGGVGCVDKLQRIGFGWIRWRPHMNGEDHLPKQPAKGEAWKWHWFDKELDEQESRGCSTHCVLYPPPQWIMEKGNPLPKDMRWPARDPRWDDLTVETTWDRFVREAVTHYKGRSLIYEIENEPEFDGWDNLKDQYARFTIRTARLIKQTDPRAKVMVDNVYGIPSGLNAVLFAAGGLKHIDVVSWHDYHEGWLSDAVTMKRMRQHLDEAGGKHVEIWFNEGWAFTNTAVDEPIACTHLNSVQSTNAIIDSVAELTANGQDKTILFHTAYEDHGMSFWDYSGPGTLLWDWYNYPLPLVAAWNVLGHHIGVSETVGFVRPVGANLCVFQDQRNGRGVVIAYADRESKADATMDLPQFASPLVAEDIMGNATPATARLVLSKSGRPVILYAADGRVSGKDLLAKLTPLDRKHASFVSSGATGGTASFQLPPTWEGAKKDSSEGNPAVADGKPIWRLDQVWPADPLKTANYRPLVWRDGWWLPLKDAFGGQPKAEMKDSALRMEFRGAHGDPPAPRICSLSFIAPRAGRYALTGSALMKLWEGDIPVRLRVLQRAGEKMTEVASIRLPRDQRTPLTDIRASLAVGDQLVLVPDPQGGFAGGEIHFHDLRVVEGEKGDADKPSAESAGGPVFRLPSAWEGEKKGSTDGNPISAGGKPVWRIDRVYPDKHIMAENYAPMPWDGTAWHPQDHEQGGQPSARIESGKAILSVAGPWQGHEFQKLAALVFLVPKDGTYRVRATAAAKPWTGGAKSFRLTVLKKDTQRAALVDDFNLPRDGKPVKIDLKVELTAGHELVFLPLVPEWNNALNVTLDELTVEAVGGRQEL